MYVNTAIISPQSYFTYLFIRHSYVQICENIDTYMQTNTMKATMGGDFNFCGPWAYLLRRILKLWNPFPTPRQTTEKYHCGQQNAIQTLLTITYIIHTQKEHTGDGYNYGNINRRVKVRVRKLYFKSVK